MSARYTVGVRKYVAGVNDAHGNPVDYWLPPTPVEVYSIAPRVSVEPVTGRLAAVEGLAVLAPAGLVVGPLDHVEIDGVEYEVDGDPGDWTRGPFGFKGGVAILLKRAAG